MNEDTIRQTVKAIILALGILATVLGTHFHSRLVKVEQAILIAADEVKIDLPHSLDGPE